MICDPNPDEPIQRSGVRVGGRSCSLSVRPPREIYGNIRQGLSRSVAAMACTTADLATNLTSAKVRCVHIRVGAISAHRFQRTFEPTALIP